MNRKNLCGLAAVARFSASAILTTGLVLLFTTAVRAGSLPNAVASFVLQDDSDSLQQVGINLGSSNPTSFTLGSIDPIAGGILASGAINPIAAATISYPASPYLTTVQVPALTANSIIEGVSGTNQSTATVDLSYSFIATGPPNTQVPIILWLNHGVDISNPNPEPSDGGYDLQGTDTVDLQGPQGGNADAFQTLGHEVLEAGYDSSDPQDAYDTYTSSYSTTGYVFTSVTSDSIETIDMQATSYVVLSTAGLQSGSIDTIVDPYITIDPSFALADEFTIEVSPYIGNDLVSSEPASVPEPGTLKLLGTAVLAVFLLARFRRYPRQAARFIAPTR